MRTYDKYRVSIIPWLNELPSHWEEKRAKYLFNKENRPVSPCDETITCFRDGQVTLRKNRRTEGFTESFKEIGYQGIRKGDLVIHQMDAFAGSTGVSDSDGKGTPVYHVCTPKVNYVNNYYYARVIRYMGLNGYIQSLYRGIRERSSDFRFDVFGKQFLPIPPLAEQEGIVAFLDEKTAAIDDLVAQVEREIELLKEFKQAEIARVVTKGLNPNAPMKPSGIAWADSIPEHWEVKRLGSAFTENRKLNSELESTEAYKFNYGALVRKDEDIELTDDIINTYKKYTVIKPSDVLINGLNLNYDFVSQRVAISFNEGIITSAYLALTPRENVNPMYYCYLLKSMDAMKLFHGMGTGIRLTLSYAELRKQPILFPPIEEQQEIVDYIDSKTTEIDRLVVELTYQVEYLKEYKQRLIADVVTGKINVQPE